MQSSQRLEWIDALRGLGMIFVIVGHMTVPAIIQQAIFSFHMPLFFFISGYLYKGNYSKQWILKKADSLIVPYIIYSFIVLLVFYSLGKCNICEVGKNILSGNGIGITWFLTCLFAVELIGGFVASRKMFSGKNAKWGLVVFMAIIGWLMPRFGIPDVFKCNVIFAAMAFWLSGNILRDVTIKAFCIPVALMLGGLFVFQRVDMNSARFGNLFLFYGTAMGSIITLIWGFKRFSIQWKPLSFIGRRSLEFMCLHAVIPMVLTFIVARSGYEVPKCVMRVVSLSAVVFAAWAIHRYSKVLSGRACLFQRLAK